MLAAHNELVWLVSYKDKRLHEEEYDGIVQILRRTLNIEKGRGVHILNALDAGRIACTYQGAVRLWNIQ